MAGHIGTIERALQLARTGNFRTMSQIREVLRAEGYSAIDSQLSGAGIRAQLRGLMRSGSSRAAAGEIGAAVASPDR